MSKLLTITLNTAYDLIGCLPRIALGEVNKVEYLGLYPAGKGINVAKVLHDLGIQSTVSGFIGRENQGEYQKMFAELDLIDHFQRVNGATRMNVKITETEADVTDLNFQGYAINEQDWQQFVDYSLQISSQFDFIAICGSLPPGVSPTAFMLWLQKLNTGRAKIVLDTSNEALTMGIQAKPWLVKPNYRELETWVGHPLPHLPDIIAAAKTLQAEGIVNVVVSLGEQGAIWLTPDNILYAQPPMCEHIVSTVGAGDAMVAGLIYGILHQHAPADTLAFASAVAAFTVSQTHVGIPDRSLLNPILENIKITSI
ncbi:1-phosphofructokinase [Pasteurella sp. P03HT]